MKLLVVDHNALDPTHRALYALIAERGDIEVRLIVPERWHNTYRTLHFQSPRERLPFELYSSKVLFYSRTHRLLYLSLARHIREFAPDVLYVNAEPENFQTYQAAMLKKSSKLVFSSWRNIDHASEGYPYKAAFVHKIIERFVLKEATHGIVFNADAQRLLKRAGFAKTTVIPPPVDTNLFRPSTRERNNAFVIGFVGRLTKAKGIDLLLNAVSALPDGCEIVIVGDGPEKTSLRELSMHMHMGARVRFLEAVAPTNLVSLYASMDVVVLPSISTKHWKEQFGRVLIEAMACGVPVIGSTSGEIPRVIGNAGLIFKEGSVEGLRLGIERLRADGNLRAELRRQGLLRVETHFALQVVAQQYHRLLTSL